MGPNGNPRQYFVLVLHTSSLDNTNTCSQIESSCRIYSLHMRARAERMTKKSVVCIKCNKKGTLSKKTTITKGKRYVYYYVQHTDLSTYKKKWCYIGKELPEEYQAIMTKEESYTQNIHKENKLNLAVKSNSPGGLAVEQQPRKLRVAGSNPARGSPFRIEINKN